MAVGEMLRHVPHCQGHLHSLRCLFSVFYDESGRGAKKDEQVTDLPPSLIGKGDMQISHGNGSIFKMKIELRKGTVPWGVEPNTGGSGKDLGET